MAFLSLSVIGGAALAGAVLKFQNRKKSLLIECLSEERYSKSETGLLGGRLPSSIEIDDKLQRFFQKRIDPLFGDNRKEQLKTLSDSQLLEISQTEKEVNRFFPLSVAALGLSVMGAFLFNPLLIGASAIGIFCTVQICQQGYEEWRTEKRLKIIHLTGLYCTGVWLGGFYVAGSLAMVLHTISEKLVIITQNRSRKSFINVFGQHPKSVWVLCDGVEVQIPFERLKKGDILVLHAGETIPSDGTIIQGQALVDQHKLTGEAQPAEKTVADPVLASTVLLAGTIQVRVEKAGSETIAAQIGQILNNTADYQAVLEAEALEICNKTVLPSLALSMLVFPVFGLQRAVAILGANYGSNLSILGPMSMLNFLNIASEKGILIKDGRVLERLKTIDTVVFDKTGTLTEEKSTITQIYSYSDMSPQEILTLAAAAEYKQTHPIAKAILEAAETNNLEIPPIDQAHYEIGYGIKVQCLEQRIWVGSYRFMTLEGLTIPPELEAQQTFCKTQGHPLVLVGVDGQVVGAIELEPAIRPETKELVANLRARNLSLYIISGDHEEPTRNLAQTLGLDGYFANTLPQQKKELIQQLQQTGHKVCFVGDGINDALALKRAEVSISLRGATSAATDTAQIVFMDGSLKQLPELFHLAESLNQNNRTNIATIAAASALCGVGILYFGFGITFAEVLFCSSVVVGLGVTTKPLLDHRKRLEAGDQTLYLAEKTYRELKI